MRARCRAMLVPTTATAMATMTLVLTAVVGANALEVPQQGSSCTPTPYEGSLCRQFINYPVGLTADAQNATEAKLQTSVSQLSLLKDVPECQAAIYRLSCASLFPRCGSTGSVQLACQSSCQDMYSICTPQLQQKTKIPPAVLDALFFKCDSLSATQTVPWGPTGKCLDYTTITPAGNGSSAGTNITILPSVPFTCPGTLRKRTSNDTNPNCDDASGCCVPCPSVAFLYPEGNFDVVVNFQTYFCLASAIATAWVVLSWSILPGRLRHPSDIVLHSAIAPMLWMVSGLFALGDPKRITCSDEVTTSTPYNNIFCGVQSAMGLYGTNASVLWIGYMIANLHMMIVWRSSFFDRIKTYGIAFCWGVPAILTLLPYFLSKVNAENGVICAVQAKDINIFQFVVPTIVVGVCFILTIITTYTIVTVTLEASTVNGSSSNGSSLEFDLETSRLSQRRQIIIIVSRNWRSVLLSFIFICTFLASVIFFNLVILPLTNTDKSSGWINDWKACIITPGNTQNFCADKFSSNVPALGSFMISVVLSASSGLWLFLIFSCNMRVLSDWVNLFHSAGTVESRKKKRADGTVYAKKSHVTAEAGGPLPTDLQLKMSDGYEY